MQAYIVRLCVCVCACDLLCLVNYSAVSKCDCDLSANKAFCVCSPWKKFKRENFKSAASVLLLLLLLLLVQEGSMATFVGSQRVLDFLLLVSYLRLYGLS